MHRTAAAASRLTGWPLQRAERRAAGLPPFGASAARKAIGQPRRPQAPEAAEVPAVRAPDAPQVVGLREELLDGGGPRTGALATAVVVKARWCGWCAPSCRQEAERRNVRLWRPEAVRQSASPRIPQIATLHGRSDDRRAVAWRCGRCSCRAELHEAHVRTHAVSRSAREPCAREPACSGARGERRRGVVCFKW